MKPEIKRAERTMPPVGHRFPRGVSGNPGGRPAGYGAMRDAARAHTDAALSVLVEALDDDDARIRIVAATALLDRGWGRPSPASPVEDAPVLTAHCTGEQARDALAAALDRLAQRQRTDEGMP